MTLTNFNLVPPPVAVLAFLGTGALTVALLAAAAIAGLAGRPQTARWLGGASLALPTVYALFLFVLGAATPERIVPRGGEKVFCEIDCHIGVAVVDVKEIGEGGRRRVAVTLRSRFDEKTISPWRGNVPLTPNPRAAALVDAAGRRFPAAGAGVEALLAPLSPGESYATTLDFEVPGDAGDLTLSLCESEGPIRLLLGHERAPFAGETALALK